MFLFFIQQETAITSRTWAPTLTWRRLTWTAQRTSSSSPVTASGTPWRRRKPPTASSLNCARIKVWTGLLKMGQSRPLFVYSHPFSHYNFNNTNWEMCWWCAWDLNPGPQDGRRRRDHGAMAATPASTILINSIYETIKSIYSFKFLTEGIQKLFREKHLTQ